MINILNFKPICHFRLRSCMHCSVNYNFRLLLDSKTIGPFAAACCSKNIYSNIFNNISLYFAYYRLLPRIIRTPLFDPNSEEKLIKKSKTNVTAYNTHPSFEAHFGGKKCGLYAVKDGKQQNKLVLLCTYSSEAAKSFEQQATTEEKTNSNSKKENQPKKQEEEANKRLLSNSSSSSVSNPPKRKTGTDEQELASLFDYISEDNPDSILDFTDFKLFAEDCCHELI